MKVKLPRPKLYLTCNWFNNYLDRKYPEGWNEEYTRVEKVLEKAEDLVTDVLTVVNRYIPKPKERVTIDKWDTWDFRTTLAPIILPMLLQLKETKQGAPHVDDEDVPAWLRSIGEEDEMYFERWDWIVDEMVFAFASDDQHWYDEDELTISRIQNGFELFGKYFQALWD